MDDMIPFLLDRVHDPESAMQIHCAQLTSSMALHLLPVLAPAGSYPKEIDISRLLGPLISMLSEQCVSVQESAGLSIAALAGPRTPPLTLRIQTKSHSLDEVREIFSRYNEIPNVSPPPKDMCLLPDGVLLLDFPSIAQARTFYVSRGAVGALHADWKLQNFPEHEATALQDDYNTYVKALGYFCPRLLHSILGSMKQRVAIRRYLFQAVIALSTLASTHPEGKRIGKSLAVAAAPIIERTLSVLKDGTRESYRERVEAARLITSLCKCFECIPILLEVSPTLTSALLSRSSDPIRQVREACQEALFNLKELSSFQNEIPEDTNTMIEIEATPEVMEAVEELEKDRSTTTISLPIEPLEGGDQSLPPVAPSTDAPQPEVVSQKPKKKSRFGDLTGAMEKLVPALAAGSATTTVRILKEMSKSMTQAVEKVGYLIDCSER